jgi:hypothetical protein
MSATQAVADVELDVIEDIARRKERDEEYAELSVW